jgi:hypothetical protein
MARGLAALGCAKSTCTIRECFAGERMQIGFALRLAGDCRPGWCSRVLGAAVLVAGSKPTTFA